MKDHIRPPIKIDENDKQVTGNGKAYRWKLNVPPSITGTKKRRLFFRIEKAAKEKRDELLASRAGLSAQQLEALAARGMTVEDAVAYTLVHAPIVAGVKMTKLLDDYVNHRTIEVGVSPTYLRTLGSYIKRIKVAFGEQNIGDIAKADIRKFVRALKNKAGDGPASPDTRNHYIQTFVAVFNYAASERLLNKLPTDGISQARGNDEEITVLTVSQAAKLLHALTLPEHAEIAPAALIQLFAATRRSETMLITWDMVTAKYLRLDSVKWGTQRRSPEMPAALLEWLAPLRRMSGLIFAPKDIEADRECAHIMDKKERERAIKEAIKPFEDGYSWRLTLAAKSAGIILPKNVLRHTAITMRVNLAEDIEAAALWAGTSVAKIRSNYRGRGTREDAQNFYALKPSSGAIAAITQEELEKTTTITTPALPQAIRV